VTVAEETHVTVPEPAAPLQVTIVTGLSGAGRGSAARCLEDLGWYVVDNMPPALLATMAGLASRSGGAVGRVAAVMDVRGRAFFADLRDAMEALERQGVHPRVLFIEASDDVLVRRFEAVRRPHPLQEMTASGGVTGRVIDGITRERELLRDLRGEADLVIDTTTTNVHELRSTIDAAFAGAVTTRLHATVVSFGFKYGLPVDADIVVDVRFLPNPHWVDELRPFSGLDPQVRDYVLSSEGAQEFLERYADLLRLVIAGYNREAKRYLTLAIGCTGGKHRSVALAEQIGAVLTAEGVETRVQHRDLGRE
jgi:UPF0042 nucleotide-binding protein